MDEFTYNCPPGPQIVKMNHYINFQKGLMSFYIIFLMFYFKNFSNGMFYYLVLHGTYGIFWVLKDQVFPDESFQRKVTISSMGIAYALVLGHYLVPAYRLASRSDGYVVSEERFWVCVTLYMFGLVFMLLADSQKFYTLKYKKGLISDGMFKYTRNPNFLGEIMIYGSFVLLVNDTISYICVCQVWIVYFTQRMLRKEKSLKLKEGYKEYAERSWVLIPKINGRTIDSLLVYGLAIYLGYTMYTNGGIRAYLMSLNNNLLK